MLTLLGLVALLAIGACDSGSPSPFPSTTSSPSASPSPGGSPSPGDGALRPVTLMLNWVPNAHHSGVYVAKARGFYADAGLDLMIVEPTAGGVEQVVGSGQVEFGVSVQEAVIPARAAEIPIVSIGTILQHNDSSLISLGEDQISRPADLAGKRYGGFGGPLETELVSRLVECDGGDPASVTFTDVGAADYLSGMQSNHYDFVWVFEGWDALRYRQIDLVDLNSLTFTDQLACVPDWYTPLFITNADRIAVDGDLVRAFMTATARGYEVAMTDPAAAADALIAGAPEIDQELARLSTAYYAGGRYVDEGRRWGLQDAEVWRAFGEFLHSAGLTEELVSVDDAWTNKFLPQE